ncbi:MAG: hypothetical protein RLZZ385_827 [Pseudomonadota bacterium]
MLQAAAFEVFGELLLHVAGQGAALGLQVGEKGRVILLDDPVEQCVLGLVALVAWWCSRYQVSARQRCWQRQVEVLFDRVSMPV